MPNKLPSKFLFKHLISLISWFVLIFLFFETPVFAQDWMVKKYTVEDGLPHDIGYGMVQDEQGFMWIGTDDGLARFDGENFTRFGEEDGLVGPYIITLSKGPKGDIFTSSYRKGVFKYQNPRFANTDWGNYPDFKIPLFHPNLYFYKDEMFLQDLRVDVNSGFLTHYQEGVGKNLVVSPGVNELIFQHITTYEVFAKKRMIIYIKEDKKLELRIYMAPDGRMFWATSIGLFEYLGNRKLNLIKKGNFSRIAGNKTGDICLVEGKKIWIWDGKTFSNMPIESPQDIDHIQINDQRIVVWFGKKANKLHFLNVSKKRAGDFDDIFTSKALYSQLMVDKKGNFWLSTQGDGLYKLGVSPFQQIALSSENKFHNVTAIVEVPPNECWVGTEKGLFMVAQTNNQKWLYKDPEKLPPALRNNQISKLAFIPGPLFSSQPSLIIGSIRGIYDYTIANQQFHFLNDSKTTAIGIDSRGRVYLREGLETVGYEGKEKVREWSFDKEFYAKYATGFSDLEPRNLNDVWHASFQRVIHFLKDSISVYSVEDGLPNAIVHDLAFDMDSNLWVVTDKGIAIFQEGKFIPHAQNTFLQGGSRKIAFDADGGIWVGGTKGIFNIKPEGALQLNSKNGLPTDAVNELYFDSQNRLWIGTIQGLFMLENPDDLILEKPPAIYLEVLTVNGDTLNSLPDCLPINADIYTKIQVVDESLSENVRVSYRLQASDDWISLNNREFSFSNLIPAPYELAFRAKTLNSSWSEPFILSVEILPPWWQRWWALASALLLLSLIAALLVRLRIQAIRKRAVAQNELNQQMAHLQLSALQSQLNPHFMFNALNAIQYFILNQDEVTANDFLAKFSRLMRLFLEASHARFISLTDELELLELYVELEQLRFDNKFSYHLTLDPGIDPDDIEIPSMMLQPYVENAINHGLRHKKEHGILHISFSEIGEKLKITIEDDGVGRAKSKEIKEGQNQQRISRGMQLLADRLKVLNEMTDTDVQIQIIDLFDDHQLANGTRVEIATKL